MKKITTLCTLVLLSAMSYAQNAPIDFESGGEGAAPWTWEVSENETNPALEFVANPNMVAPNASAMVAKFTARADGKPWALCFTDSIGSFTFDATNNTVKIMVWKTRVSDVAIKFEEVGNPSTAKEIKVANTKTSEWEELTFDFSSVNGNTYDRMVLIPDFLERTAENVLYFDNITFSSGVTLNEPMVAAPDPTFPATDVISLFSGTYTDSTVATWRAPWCTASLSDVQVAGNDVKKYTSFGVAGIEPGTGNFVDATNMTHFNVSVWSPNVDTFRVKLVDWGADESYGGGDDTEDELQVVTNKKDTWYNHSMALSDFTGMTSKNNIAQIILSSPNSDGVVYIDNIFFNKEAASSTTSLETEVSASVYPNPAKERINVNTPNNTTVINSIALTDIQGKEIVNRNVNSTSLNETFEISNLAAGVYYLVFRTEGGNYTHKVVVN